jgi:hypothetical protein
VPLFARELPSDVLFAAFDGGDDYSHVTGVSAQAGEEAIELLV